MKTPPELFWVAGWSRAVPRRESPLDVTMLGRRRRGLSRALRRARRMQATPGLPFTIEDLNANVSRPLHRA